jgi:hypothetical protein
MPAFKGKLPFPLHVGKPAIRLSEEKTLKIGAKLLARVPEDRYRGGIRLALSKSGRHFLNRPAHHRLYQLLSLENLRIGCARAT